MGIYEDVQKGQLEEQTFIKKSLVTTIGEMLGRIKDEISKAKKAEIGTVSTHGGKKVRKEANGWVPVKEGGGEKSGEGEEEKKPSTLEELGEHAKKASEQALTNATKMSSDPVVREAAHKELMRRKNEEAQDTFKDPNGAKPESGSGFKEVDEKITPKEREDSKVEGFKEVDDEAAKDIDWITRLVKGGHLDMAKKEVQNLDTNVREMLPKAIYDKAMGIEKEKKEPKPKAEAKTKKLTGDDVDGAFAKLSRGEISAQEASDTWESYKKQQEADGEKKPLKVNDKVKTADDEESDKMLEDAAEKGVESFDWEDEEAAVKAFTKLAGNVGLKFTEHPSMEGTYVLSKKKLTDRQIETMSDDPYDYPKGTEIVDIEEGGDVAADAFIAAMSSFGHEVKYHESFDGTDEVGIYVDSKGKEKEEKPRSVKVNEKLKQQAKILEKDDTSGRIEGKNGFTDDRGEWHGGKNFRDDIRFKNKMAKQGELDSDRANALPGSSAWKEKKEEKEDASKTPEYNPPKPEQKKGQTQEESGAQSFYEKQKLSMQGNWDDMSEGQKKQWTEKYKKEAGPHRDTKEAADKVRSEMKSK